MKSNSQSRKEQTSEPVRKPYLTGSITDENTLKASLGFFGIMLITVFVAFIVCAAATFDSFILRLLMNTAVIHGQKAKRTANDRLYTTPGG